MNLIKNLSELTADALAEFQKAAVSPAQQLTEELRKSGGVNQATGLVAYDLQAPAKNLFPVLTPLRNRIPRIVSQNGGTATNWISVTGINTSKLRGFVPEGRRNGLMSISSTPKSASYKSCGLDDAVTFEAELAATGFENVRSTQAQRLLWATMIEEELSDLGACNSVALGTPTAPTVVVGATGGTIADAAGGYYCYVVALTLHGYLAASLTDGVQQTVTVTTPVNTTFTYGGGSSNSSLTTNTGAVSNSNVSKLSLSTPVVAGAVAYAWYVGTTTGATLQAITTLNSVVLTSLTTTHQAITSVTADKSTNALAYDGVLYQAWASGSGAYIKNMATGTPGTGTGLTADNAGGITEIDDMLASMWENYKLSPSTIYLNAREGKNITKKILGGSGVQHLITVDQGQGFTSGAVVARYMNKFAMGTSTYVDVMVHPYMPAGTLMAYTDMLPYPISGVPNVVEKRLRRDYYQMEWPMREGQYENGVYFDGVLAHYFPPSVGIITNIADA